MHRAVEQKIPGTHLHIPNISMRFSLVDQAIFYVTFKNRFRLVLLLLCCTCFPDGTNHQAKMYIYIYIFIYLYIYIYIYHFLSYRACGAVRDVSLRACSAHTQTKCLVPRIYRYIYIYIYLLMQRDRETYVYYIKIYIYIYIIIYLCPY